MALLRLVAPNLNIPVEVEGFRMYVRSRDVIIGSCLFFEGVWEKATTEIFKRELRPGMVVIDVGASIGYFTLLAAKLVGEAGKVYAFEPEPGSYRFLSENIRTSGYKNIVPVQKACFQETGTIDLFLLPVSGWATVMRPRLRWPAVKVDAVRLDDFFADYDGQVDFIKVDIEGAELAALEGMRELIKRNENLKIVLEYNPSLLKRHGLIPEEFVTDLAQNYGFQLEAVIDDWRGRTIECRDMAFLTSMSDRKIPVNLLMTNRISSSS